MNMNALAQEQTPVKRVLLKKCIIISAIGAVDIDHAGFGQGAGLIALSFVQCQGTEANLTSCAFSIPYRYDYHSNDASVRCKPCKLFYQSVNNDESNACDGLQCHLYPIVWRTRRGLWAHLSLPWKGQLRCV